MGSKLEVSFVDNNEYIILTQEGIHRIIDIVRDSQCKCIKVKLECFMSEGYRRYIINVINANRDKQMFKCKFKSPCYILKFKPEVFKVLRNKKACS